LFLLRRFRERHPEKNFGISASGNLTAPIPVVLESDTVCLPQSVVVTVPEILVPTQNILPVLRQPLAARNPTVSWFYIFRALEGNKLLDALASIVPPLGILRIEVFCS
jgi:hypothetical protein